MTRRSLGSIVGVLLVLGGASMSADEARQGVLSASSGGSRGAAFGALTAAVLDSSGYVERELFLEGDAAPFEKAGPWLTDGAWPATQAATTAKYKIRLLVRQPADVKKFNGVVVVEWLNVTGRSEAGADFMHMQEELLRGGYGWVGAGVQAVGVNAPGTGLKAWDAERYGTLVHPGDKYSYDIFSQVARAIRKPQGLPPVASEARLVLATGRSQSAFRLVTYINAVHLRTKVFDGFLVHSRGANAAGLTAEGMEADPAPTPVGAHIRSDLDVPILDVQAEGDITALRSHLTRQPPTPRYRRWEIAGAAHAETPRWVVEVLPPLDLGPGCATAVNAAPHHAVVKAALQTLMRWARFGVPAPQSPDVELQDPTAATPVVVRDQHGNARGGIRLPQLEAPTATLDGRLNVAAQKPPPPTNFCFLFGGTVPFDAATLKSLYPDRESFVKKFNDAADAIVRQGYWLEAEATRAKADAAKAKLGR
jgi:hypothetical protein